MITKYKTKLEKLSIDGNSRKVQLDLEVLVSLEETIDELFAEYKETGETQLLEDRAPYFGTIWPVACSLSTYLLNKFEDGWKNKRILELGCGLAVPSLALAKWGCSIDCVDFHPDVPIFLKRNMSLNGIETVHFFLLDNREKDSGLELGKYDIVLASDLIYERGQAEVLAGALERYLNTGGTAYVADPGRPYLQEFVNCVKSKGMDAREIILSGPESFLIEVRSRPFDL